MTQEIRKRYEDALETLRGIVDRTGYMRDKVRALIRLAASDMLDALEKDPNADLEDIIEDFRGSVEEMVEENMREAAQAAEDGDSDDNIAAVSLPLTLSHVDISTPVQKYATALSQEVKWFVAGGFAYGALYEYLKDPLGFLASESVKPMQKKATRQTEGRMTLAPAFMDGKRRQSLSEVLKDFRDYISAVSSGNSYEVGKSAWGLLIYTSMKAYNDALATKWAGKGAIGYYVFRGSTYDCPACDEQCGWLHPLTDMAIPVHLHCLCITVPAYAGETPKDFEI